MAELAALNVKITGDASGIKAAANSAKKSVTEFTKSAESSAKVFERAFAQNERSVDRLRQSIDPLYASSKRYETAVNTLDKALKSGSLSQAQHARLLEQAGAAYLRTGGQAAAAATQTAKMSGAFGLLGNMSKSTGAKMQQVGFQLQDVAIQLQAGTRASVVFAQQGSQIASVFGAVGAIIGTLAAVGIPLLAVAFASAADNTKSFDEALSSAKDSLANLKSAAAVFSSEGIQGLIDKYGELNAEILHFIELQRQVTVAEALTQTRDIILAIEDDLDGMIGTVGIGLANAFDLQTKAASKMVGMLREVKDAKTFEAQLAAVTALRAKVEELTGGVGNTEHKAHGMLLELIKAEDVLRQLNTEGAKASGWLDAAIGGATTLAGKLWDAATAAAKVRSEQSAITPSVTHGRGADPRQFMTGASNSFGGTLYGTLDDAGGSGVATNPAQSQIEALQQSLLTQEEIQLASFARQQEALQMALEQRLITQEEYAAMMESAQQKHADAMSEIDLWRYGDGLQKAGAFFGGMADAFANGNEEMLRVSKAFGAAEALINAWRAYSQTIADPSLPFFAKLAAAAKVLAAGMGAVNAIKGAGKGGGGTSSATATTANANVAPLNVQLNGISPGSLYSGADIGSLLDRLGEEAGDRGYRLVISR